MLDALFAKFGGILVIVELETVAKSFSCFELLTEVVRVDLQNITTTSLNSIDTVELNIE